MDDGNDDARLAELLSRDPDAGLREALRCHQGRLLRLARGILRDSLLAEDAVQEAFVRLHACRGEVEHPAPWLRRVVTRSALDLLRKEERMRRLHLAAAPDGEPLSESADAPYEEAERAARLGSALATLSPNERAVVHLKVREGLSYREIAETTGLSEGNVGYLLHHGLKKVTAALRERAVPAPRLVRGAEALS